MASIQYVAPDESNTLLNKSAQEQIQSIVRTFIYNGQVANPTILSPPNKIVTFKVIKLIIRLNVQI